MVIPPLSSPRWHQLARRHRRSRALLLSGATWRQRLTFWGGAAAVGVVAALFAAGADEAQLLFHRAVAMWPLLPLVVTPAGLALSAWLTLTVFDGAQGSGIPQAMAARELRRPDAVARLLSLRVMAGKLVLTLLGLACGASIGREGPTVQVGAAIMLAAGAAAGLGRQPGLILAGGAAGVAAAFNTPLAGIVFAIEELAHGFERRTNGLVLSAVIVAGLAAMALSGNYTYFGRTAAAVTWADWQAVPAAGIAGGIAGGLFCRLVLGLSAAVPRLWAGRLGRQPVLVAALCGLAIAGLGVAGGGLVYGTGYHEARAALEGAAPLPWSYALQKLAATVAASVSGIPGGIFAPSLSIGAGVGDLLAGLMPHSPAAVLIVLSMAAFFAGAVQAPVTATVIVMEMTDDHAMVLPLMAASLVAYGLSRLISAEPLYHALAQRFITRLAVDPPPAADPAPAATAPR